MSYPTTVTTTPCFDDGNFCGQRLVLNVEMSFIREQLASQSTQKTRTAETMTNFDIFNSPRQSRLRKPKEKRRLHPLDVYFKSEEARRRHASNVKYQYRNYSVETETLEPLEGNVNSDKLGKPEPKVFLPEIDDNKETRRVDFSKGNNQDNGRLPSLNNASRNTSALANYCDVTFSCKTPPTPRFSSNNRSRRSKGALESDSNLYNITFRSKGSRNYDPESELHSDYYTIRKVESRSNVVPKSDNKATLFNNEKRKKKFSAILIGTQKYLHKKHDIGDDGHRSVPIEEWSRPKLSYNPPGYSSVPLRRPKVR